LLRGVDGVIVARRRERMEVSASEPREAQQREGRLDREEWVE